jgi:hypothetical protein
MKKTIKKAKHRRSDEARAAVNLITASASVENIVESRAKKSLKHFRLSFYQNLH